MLVWDSKQILEFCGDNESVIRICAQSDRLTIPPRPATVSVWRYRNRISAEWLPPLVEYCLDHGMSVSRLFRCEGPDNRPSLEDVGL
jgi:hypothetical protein